MSELPSELKHWDFDPTGLKPENLVEKEEHYISARDPYSALVSPLYGPFYSATVYTADGVEVPKSHYEYGERIPQLVGVVDRPLYHNLIIKGYENQAIFVSYQIPGAEYTRMKHDVLNWLASKLNEDTRTKWERVTDLPHKQATFAHRHHWLDYKNTQLVRTTLDNFKGTIEGNKTDVMTEVFNEFSTRLDAVENRLHAYLLHDHVDQATINSQLPHTLTPQNIFAEVKGSRAKNADSLFNLSYIAFLTELRAGALNWIKLKDYVRKENIHNFEGDIISNLGIYWGSVINGNFSISTLLRVGSRKSLKFGAEGATLNITPAAIDFNGYQLYDWWSALQYSSEQTGSYSISIRSDDFDVTGTGTGANPLTLSLRYSPATLATPGFVRLSGAPSASSDGWGYTSYAAFELDKSVVNYLPGTTTINGHVIGKDIVITKANIGLALVDDTSDINKPVSDAQQVELNKLSKTTHKHNWTTLTWTDAGVGVAGIDKLAVEFLDVEGAVSASLGYKFNEYVNNLFTLYEQKASDTGLNLTFTKGVRFTKTPTGIELVAGEVHQKVGFERNVYLLAGMSVDYLANTGDVTRFGVYYVRDGELAQVKIDWPGRNVKEEDILLFTFDINDFERTYEAVPVIDYGQDANLTNHINHLAPHDYNKSIPELSRVINRGMVKTISRGKSLVWLPSGMAEQDLTEYVNVDNLGIVSHIPGNSPMRWKSVIAGATVYQSSFAVGSNIPAVANVNLVPYDVILGYDIGATQLRSLNIRMEDGYLPRLYIERYEYERNESGEIVPLAGAHTQLYYTTISQEAYNLPESSTSHFRFYLNAATLEFRFEVVSPKHIVLAGSLTGVTQELREELIEMLETDYTGFKAEILSKLTVVGAIRAPHPNTQNEINDYRGLFNSYISTPAIEQIRHNNREMVGDYTFNCYYDVNYDALVFEDVPEVLPGGYNIFDANLISIDRLAGEVQRDLDEAVLYRKLSMGALSRVSDWFDGYAGNLSKYRQIVIPFLPKEYIDTPDGPVEVTDFIQHNERFKVTVRFRCAYTLWGVSSADWGYLAKHMATAPTNPEQPDFEVAYALDGLESVQLR